MALQVCAPWTTPDKLCCEGGGTTDDCVSGTVPLVYEWSDDQVILAASNILYARTCYRYPGVCTATVWPCVDGCSSAKHPCVRCCRFDAIELPTDYPVITIVDVIEDGVTLAPTDYRLERGNILVRLDGNPWQTNTFGLPDVSGVETTVEYTFGVAPPIELEMAAAALACELKKSCNGNECALPAHVTSFARRGVAVELTDLAEMLKSGATGIPIVDHALKVHGNCGWSMMYDPASVVRGLPVVP